MFTPEGFYKKVMAATTSSEIEKLCNQLKMQLFDTLELPTDRTVDKKLYKAGYSQFFKDMSSDLLTPENSYVKTKRNGEKIVRHLFYAYMGYDDIDYESANKHVEYTVNKKATNQIEIDVKRYFETAEKLLKSTDMWELCAGLIATTGRRPAEIMYSAEFSAKKKIPDYLVPEYAVYFSGQLKRKDSDKVTEYYIGTLLQTKELIKLFKKFRAFPEMQEYHKQADKMKSQGKNDVQINEFFDNKTKSINRVIERDYGWLPEFDIEEVVNDGKCSKLRAIYGKIITKRDCPKNYDEYLFNSMMLGHTEEGGRASSTTMNYRGFYLNTELATEIPYLTLTGEKTMRLMTYEQEHKEIKELATEWNCTQQDAIRRLLAEYKELKANKKEPVKTQKAPVNFESMDTQILFSGKFVGGVDEKLNRLWNAITTYNDETPEYKINPTNKIIRELSGVNGQAVTKWLQEHETIVNDHCIKHGFDTYYNNRYRAHKQGITTDSIIEKIKNEYLLAE